MRLHGGKRRRLALIVREARLGSEVEVVEEGEAGLIAHRVDHPDGRHDVRIEEKRKKRTTKDFASDVLHVVAPFLAVVAVPEFRFEHFARHGFDFFGGVILVDGRED